MSIKSEVKPNLQLIDFDELQFVRNGAISTARNPVLYDTDHSFVYKPDKGYEMANYDIIDKYRRELLQRGVVFSYLMRRNVGFNSVETQGTHMEIVTLPYFESYNVAGYFGDFPLHGGEEEFSLFLKSLKSIGDVLPEEPFKKRGEPDEEDASTALPFLRGCANSLHPQAKEAISEGETTEIITRTQPRIEGITRRVTHKDANPSNWRVLYLNGNALVNFIDLESLGLARPGWDEGRVYTSLSLDPVKKEQFKRALSREQDFQDPNTMLYFWRTVLSRSMRELSLLNKGRYDINIDALYPEKESGKQFKEKTQAALVDTLVEAKEILHSNL